MVTPETTTSVATLETPRLWLRGPSLDDVPAYQRHFADYEVIRHLSAAVPWPYPEDGVEQWLRNVVLPAQGQDRWTWGNERSRRIKEKCGARWLGTEPARFVDPSFREHELWELTKANWQAR